MRLARGGDPRGNARLSTLRNSISPSIRRGVGVRRGFTARRKIMAIVKPLPKIRVVLSQGSVLLAAEPPLGRRGEPAVSVYGEPRAAQARTTSSSRIRGSNSSATDTADRR